jgi:hypothetical protein
MAKSVEYSLGCVDLRDIESVRLLSETDGADVKRFKGKNIAHWFEVRLAQGQGQPAVSTMFEAHGVDVAEEWVERLRGLTEYWKHRHRVE